MKKPIKNKSISKASGKELKIEKKATNTEERRAKRESRLEEKITKRQNQSSLRKWTADIVIIITASLIYSTGIHCFTAPNEIAPGGVTGIATIINSLTGISIGLLYGVMNLPLIIIGFIFLGRKTMVKTIISVAVITVSTDYLFTVIPVYEGNRMLAAIFGGALFGVGLGLIYTREGTSGGTDITNRIIHKKIPHFSLGKIMLAADAVILLSAMFIYKNIEAGLYAIISIFVCSKMVDMLLYGMLEGKLLLIFSDRYEVITERILKEHNRGVTLLDGEGGFSGREKKVICCAVQKNQYVKIKRIVSQVDPHAFIVVTNAGEVLGEGFHENKIS